MNSLTLLGFSFKSPSKRINSIVLHYREATIVKDTVFYISQYDSHYSEAAKAPKNFYLKIIYSQYDGRGLISVHRNRC
jgi:hypothetical protein